MNVEAAREVHTYDDLRGMFGDNIDCMEMVDIKECFFHYDAFNIFNLEKRSQKFYFRIDRNDKITERKIDEIVTEYHIIPSAELPGSFKEFE
jgi:hypothetical protein